MIELDSQDDQAAWHQMMLEREELAADCLRKLAEGKGGQGRKSNTSQRSPGFRTRMNWLEEFDHYTPIYWKGIDMGRYASEPGNTFEQAPADTHVARCVKLIDLGTLRGEYQSQPTARNQVMITWELPQALMTKGEAAGMPFIVSAFLTNSLGEKAKLRGWLEAWRGKEFTAAELKKFDLQNILGFPCLVTVIHNEKGKAQVTGVTKLPKGFECPPQVNKPVAFWLDQFNQDTFDALPEGIQNIIAQSEEYKAMRHVGSDVAAPLAAAAPAAPTGAELEALRRDVVRVINEQVGPLAGSLVARLGRTRSADDLRPLLDSASRVVGLMRGDEAAADFRARFMNW